jgi:hypothetical protein
LASITFGVCTTPLLSVSGRGLRESAAQEDHMRKFQPVPFFDDELDPRRDRSGPSEVRIPQRRRKELSKLFSGKMPEIAIPDEAVRDIAKRTGVSKARVPQMRLSIRTVVQVATTYWRRPSLDAAYASARQSLRPLLKAAHSLCDGLANLDEGAKRLLYLCLEDAQDGYYLVPRDHGGLRDITIQDYQELIADLARAADDAVRLRPKRRRPGAPKGTRFHALEFLVHGLRTAIENEGGGRLTYVKHGGNLVDVLRPHVAKGLIPLDA